MKKDTVDEIVGRALRGEPYVPTGDEDVPVSAQPAAPPGVAYAELPKDVIRAVFIENGFTIKEGQSDLKQYVYDAAQALLRAAHGQAPALAENGHLTQAGHDLLMEATLAGATLVSKGRLVGDTAQAAPAAGAVAGPSQKPEDFEVTLYPPMPTSGFRIGMPKGVKVLHKPTGLFATSEDERSQHRNRDVALDKLQAMLDAAPTPAAQADSQPAPVFKHVCNLWVDPETCKYVVDGCDHPTNELIGAYVLVDSSAASAKADSVLEDAARWNEVLMHVGAANHLGGQHFTLNTLRIRDQMFLLRGSVAQHFTACIDDSRAARKQGGTQ